LDSGRQSVERLAGCICLLPNRVEAVPVTALVSSMPRAMAPTDKEHSDAFAVEGRSNKS
jgi:hypothetical protein